MKTLRLAPSEPSFLAAGQPTAESPGRSLGAPAATRLDTIDIALFFLYLLGIYTGFTLHITAKVPFPSAIAGIAGMVLLWRRRNQIAPVAMAAYVGVVLLYLISIFCATDITFLSRRLNGFIQLVYSLSISFALFLTVTKGERRQVGGLFLGFAVVVLIGCLLEDYGGLRPISDVVRRHIYSAGVYEADVRDLQLYGRIRPKFFASEPSVVTFAFTFYTFMWYVISRWRWKLALYVVLFAVGTVAMPGPTLLLMLILLAPYELFLAGRYPGPQGRIKTSQLLKIACFLPLILVGSFYIAHDVFANRMAQISAGKDPSFFYRVLGPALAAVHVLHTYPVSGAGLTGEPFVANEILGVYMQSPDYSANWKIEFPSTELLINYFWLHWIYLGFVWGSLMVAAVSGWLKALKVPTVLFCWTVWAILGQGAGAYVGPITWTVLFLAAAGSVLARREPEPPAPLPEPAARRWIPILRPASRSRAG